MALQLSEAVALDKLYNDLQATAQRDRLLERYYDGLQRFEHIGLAIPPQYRRGYEVVTSGPAVVVDSVVERQQVRSLVLPGEEDEEPRLRAIWDGSNMDQGYTMFCRDRRLYGRAFISVGSNEHDPDRPLMRVEAPLEMAVLIDVRHEVATAAARFYGKTENGSGPAYATLYLPDVTVWLARSQGRWVEIDRDDHKLGEVPILMSLRGRLSGGWRGRSALTRPILSVVDGSARNLTNLQFAVEAHGAPRVWMTGVAKGDFVDATGKPMPVWEAYFNAIHTLAKADAKIGQLTAADLKNFETAQLMYAREMSAATGFPSSYFGISTANPPAEGAIVGEEKRLVRTCESENTEAGMAVGWAAALAYRFATGTRIEGNRVRVDCFNPATPTIAQRMDAVVKAKQAGIVSREGSWDELGWSEARKAKERAYFAAEADDPEMRLARELIGDAAQ